MDELAIHGHEAALTELAKTTAHSLLLVGPEGVGRRRAARWFAARLNCLASQETRPCGSCESCARFPGHPDYREIAPSLTTSTGRRNPHPEIRIGQLVPRPGEREEEPLSIWLERRPAYRARVGVIDGADRLTLAAANAFLKVLEEPPSYARLVLIAASAKSVLPTVASRCTVVRFGAVDTSPFGHPEHPAHRLGRPGPLLLVSEPHERAEAAAAGFAAAVAGTLTEALAAADELAAAWQELTGDGLGMVELLREKMRDYPPPLRVPADDLLLDCQEALDGYSPATLATRVLMLRLRGSMRNQAEDPETLG